jgi:hypothetical protein
MAALPIILVFARKTFWNMDIMRPPRLFLMNRKIAAKYGIWEI